MSSEGDVWGGRTEEACRYRYRSIVRHALFLVPSSFVIPIKIAAVQMDEGSSGSNHGEGG